MALWLATRGRLPSGSELYRKDPLSIVGVLGLAAVTDLAEYRVGPAESCHASVDLLMGGTPQTQPARYAEASPRALLPLRATQVFIQGARDPIVDPASVRAYVEAAQKAGDHAVLLPLPEAGHFEASTPLPENEMVFLEALQELLAAGK